MLPTKDYAIIKLLIADLKINYAPVRVFTNPKSAIFNCFPCSIRF